MPGDLDIDVLSDMHFTMPDNAALVQPIGCDEVWFAFIAVAVNAL
jgi:hypothetical protein